MGRGKKFKTYGDIVDSGGEPNRKLLVGIPMTGLVRSEWAMARYGQVTPTNWSMTELAVWLDQFSPVQYSVAEARNMIATRALMNNVEWLFFIDHDVILPPGALIMMNQHMMKKTAPIVNGLYFTKSVPAEPLIYKKIGDSYYDKWTIGDKVWVRGAGLGCTLIHTSIFRAMAKDMTPQKIRNGQAVFKFFRTPASMNVDMETGEYCAFTGTEDIDFYERVRKGGYYAKAGWKKFQKKKYPILIDTSIFCKHIAFDGKQYPIAGEVKKYAPKDKGKK